MVEIGIVGKPNVGKSTFFNAATSKNAAVANYPFTTIEANEAIGYARINCVCTELNVKDNPRNSICISGRRFIPVKLIDVAGLVPGAHEGRGLGNKFLDDLRKADALIHVVDASAGTDEEGNIIGTGKGKPEKDIDFLENEIHLWFFSILKRNWNKITRRAESEKKELSKTLAEAFAGIGIGEHAAHEAINRVDFSAKAPSSWNDDELLEFAKIIFRETRKIVIAANKTDVDAAYEIIKELKKKFPEHVIIPVSGMAEIILKNLAEKRAIKYIPGDESFEIIDSSKINDKEKMALKIIEKNVFTRFKGTGVVECINRAVFELLEMIAVYPVEDENKFADSRGNVLPDVFLVKHGATPRELAEKIHSDIAEHFMLAIDAKTKKMVAKDYKLKHRDVIKIVFRG